MNFKVCVIGMLYSLERKIDKMSEVVKQFKDDVEKAFQQVNDSLDNIVADEAKLAKDLADFIANHSGAISAEDLDALAVISNAATAMAVRTKSIADNIPDVVTQPVGPPTPLP